MIYDGINKKYVSREELINKYKRKIDILTLLKENNEKLDKVISLIKEALKNGGKSVTGTEEKAGDSKTGIEKA